MTARRRTPDDPPPPNTMREDFAALKQLVHEMKNQQQVRLAADIQAARVPASKGGDTPLWLKVTGAAIVALLGGLALLAMVFNRGAAEQALVFRLDMIERSAADRDRERDRSGDSLRARVSVLEQANQQSGITDARTDSSLRGLEQAVKALSESLGARLERIERQRGTSWQSAPLPPREEPTVWRMPLRLN